MADRLKGIEIKPPLQGEELAVKEIESTRKAALKDFANLRDSLQQAANLKAWDALGAKNREKGLYEAALAGLDAWYAEHFE